MRKLIQFPFLSLPFSALLCMGTYAAAVDHALPPGPYVSTSGEAKLEQMPDFALVTVGLRGEGESAEHARDALDEGAKAPTYHLADESSIRGRVRELALEDARRNAEMLASSQDARLGAVWGVVYRPMHEDAARFSTGTRRADGMSGGINIGTPRTLSIPLEPQAIPYAATVGVVYRLELDSPDGDRRDE